MNKLLSAGFSRLWKNKVFWIGILLMSGMLIFVLVSNYRDMMRYIEEARVGYIPDTFLPGCFMFIGCFTSVFAALFLGTEYSDGTIRNKLVVGHSRISVYLSCLILCIVSSLLVCVAATLVTFLAGIPLFGLPLYPTVMLQKFGIGILMVTAFSGIFTLPVMLIHNKSISSVVCIIGFFTLVFLSIYIMQRLEAPEFIDSSFVMSVDGEIIPGDPFPNPSYLRGTTRSVYEFFADFLPTSQSFRIVQSGALPHPWRFCAYSSLTTVVSTLVGTLLFRKKDIK